MILHQGSEASMKDERLADNAPAIAELRREYARTGLSEHDADRDPFHQFARWFGEALAAGVTEPNAFTLATATREGLPSARVVLLKGYDERGFAFYTNYESRKGAELAENPAAAMVFYWSELERQIRISGRATRLSRGESDAYFRSRPTGSRLGAWASAQSRPIPTRAILEERLRQLEAEHPDGNIPLPPFWGGFRVAPTDFEFWQGRPNRLHDRLRYRRAEDDSWTIERLSP
jgi:pyridoxamine 5'-phosphate oxidase